VSSKLGLHCARTASEDHLVYVILTDPAENWDFPEGKVVDMNPVMRALQTIAAIESETRLASSNRRNGPTAPSANSKATADLNRGSGAPPIAQVRATTPEAAFAWDREIRIDKRDRVAVAPGRDVTRSAITIITGVLSLALALFLGWVGGFNLDFFTTKPASLPVEKVNSSADPPHAVKSEPTATRSAHETSKRGGQTVDSLLSKQPTGAPQPTAVERTKGSTKPTAVPETRPTTIEGWTIREVNGGTVVLEGPNGVWKATRGDTVPGVGKIDSIVRWGSRWIVATSRGLISTR
jgi:hypothetical protein